MGIGPKDLMLLTDMKKAGVLDGLKSVCDIGAQQLHCGKKPEFVEKFLRAFGVDPLPGPSLVAEIADGAYAERLWRLCGIDYLAIDTSSETPTLNLDLNFDAVPLECAGRFQLVTNFGTTEHVGNQITAMKIMHDLCATGGVMYHVLPLSGFQNHGFLRYNPKFFWCLCRSNNYRCLDFNVDIPKSKEGLHPDIVQMMVEFGHSSNATVGYLTDVGGLRVLVGKSEAAHFKPPFDGVVGTEIDGYPSRYAELYAVVDEIEPTGWEDAARASALAQSALQKLVLAPARNIANEAAWSARRSMRAWLPKAIRQG